MEVELHQRGNLDIIENGEYDVTNYAQATVNVSSVVLEENDVNFYDYDGTLLYSYSKSDFLNLTELPANPSHTGLTSQGWNWSLADAKEYVTDYNKLQLGQMYNTTSEKTEIDIELTTVTGLTVTLNMNGTKDWGDGNSDDLTSHTYSQNGKYTITCTGDTISGRLFGQSSSSKNYYCKFIRFSNFTTLPSYSLEQCLNLEFITLPTSITLIDSYALQYCYSLKSIVIPSSVINLLNYGVFSNCLDLVLCIFPKFSQTFTLGRNMFNNNYALRNIILSENVIGLDLSCFSNVHELKEIIFPKTLAAIGNSEFAYSHSLIKFDFSKHTSIPTLNNRNAFDEINAEAKIIVPNSLYSTWRTEGNWIYMQNYIVNASEV